MSGLKIQEVSEKMGSKSPNDYAQYEKSKINISLEYEQLLIAVNPVHPHTFRII